MTFRPLRPSRAFWTWRWPTFAVWAAVAASAVYWLLLGSQDPQLPPKTRLNIWRSDDTPSDPPIQTLARALGSEAVASASAGAPAVSRWQLQGVVLGTGLQPVALLALEGQTPKPYVQGAVLDGTWRLVQVQPQRVLLQAVQGGVRQELRLLPVPDSGATELR